MQIYSQHRNETAESFSARILGKSFLVFIQIWLLFVPYASFWNLYFSVKTYIVFYLYGILQNVLQKKVPGFFQKTVYAKVPNYSYNFFTDNIYRKVASNFWEK